MGKNHNNSPKSSLDSFDFNSFRETQLKKVFASFYEKPKSMKEVYVETGILREHICRYCKILRQQFKLYFVAKKRCKITGHNNVSLFTTNPEFAPKQTQLKLF